ncbi:MAG: hypothetical protein Q9195_009263, partial [Heterodermia aff. obscurata]
MQTVSIYKDHDLGIFIAKTVLLLIAPPVYSLTNYFVLGRVLFYVPYLSPIHPGRVMSTFVGLDAVVGILTGNGASRSANTSNTPSEMKAGADMVRASIILQLACFVGFIALEMVFHSRCIKASVLNQKLQRIITLLYVSSALILVRNIYRVVEVWEGYDSYLTNHEAFFYVFDGALMLVNTVMWNVWHPMEFLPNDNKIYLSKDGRTELEGPGWIDKRPFLVTLFDPFDLAGLIRGKDKANMFWENEEKHQKVADAGATSGEAGQVEYTDPSKIYQNISQGLSRRLPLRNLHWTSSSRPLRSIKSLHVELLPDDKRSSGLASLEQSDTQSQDTLPWQGFPNRSKAEDRPALSSTDSSTKRERRHQIPGLRQTPYLKIYLLRCDDVDSYKASSRKLIREWVKDHTPAFQKSSKYNTQENHEAFEWLILHVISADSQGTDRAGEDRKGDSRWSKRSSTNLIEKIRTDFNGTSNSAVDRVAQVYLSGEAVGQSSDDGDTGWGDLIFKMKSLILASFDLRVRQYEEDIKERESQRSLPGWNFNTFFVLKEGLAMGFESVGLIEDALRSYHELAVGLHSILEGRFADGPSTTSASQFQDYTNDLLVEVKKAAAIALGASLLSNGDEKDQHGEATTSEDLGHDILSTDRKPFRELILANKISAFDFQCYIFARQAALLLRMGNASTPMIEDAPDRPSPQPMRSSSPSLGPTHEVENLLILADVCQRAVEFITSACRTMRNELGAILKTNTDGKTEGSLISFPSQETVVENLTASWIYSTAECVLSRTSAKSLSAQLQPLMRQLKPQQQGQANTKAASSPELPRRTSSLSPNSSMLQRPPSPEKFPSVTSLDAMRLLPPGPMQTGAQNLAADRAALHALKRRALSQAGLSYGGWRSGWPHMHLGEALEEHPMEEVSLDEAPNNEESPNGTVTEKRSPFSMNGVRHKLLREALSSEESFYAAYEDVTALTLALDVLGKRKKSAEALTADLAAVRFHMKDYAAAASYFRQLAPFYAQGEWSELELVMLDLYTQCLGYLDRKEEYVSVALKIVAKQVEANRTSRHKWKADLQTSNYGVTEPSGSYLHNLIAASKSLERQLVAPIERYFGHVSLDPRIRHSDKYDSFHLILNLKLLTPEILPAEEIRVCLVRMTGQQRSELWLTAANVTIATGEVTQVSVASR